MNTPAHYMTAADLVARWGGGIHIGTLANWRHKGRGPAFVKLGGRVLYSVAAVEAWERDNMHGTAANQTTEPGNDA